MSANLSITEFHGFQALKKAERQHRQGLTCARLKRALQNFGYLLLFGYVFAYLLPKTLIKAFGGW